MVSISSQKYPKDFKTSKVILKNLKINYEMSIDDFHLYMDGKNYFEHFFINFKATFKFLDYL